MASAYPRLTTLHAYSASDSDAAIVVLMTFLAFITHQIFKNYETYSFTAHASLVLIPPATVLYAIESTEVFHSLFVAYGTYLTTLVLSVLIYRLSPFHPLSRYPGPTLLKTTKISFAYVAAGGQSHHYIKALHERYGDVVRIGPNELSISDASAVVPLLGASGVAKGHFLMGGSLSEKKVSMIGLTDSRVHLLRRRAWNRALSTTAIQEYEPLVADRVQQLVARLMEQHGDVSMDVWINRFSYDLMCDLTFGGGSDSMRDGDRVNFWSDLEKGMEYVMLPGHLPWLGMYLGLIPGAAEPISAFISRCAKLVSERMQREVKKKDLLHYLNNEDLPNAAAPPIQQLYADGVLGVVAGSDTSASAMISIIHCLLTNPQCYAALQQEVDKYYPAGDDASQATHQRGMHYLDAVIHEALRLFPPAPHGGQRRVPATSHAVVVGSLVLPPDTSFWIPPYTLHRDPRNFSFPDTFWPERWLIASGALDFAQVSPPAAPCSRSDATATSPPKPVGDRSRTAFVHNESAFTPFSYGPMNCAGKGLAILEIRTVVCALMQRFELRLSQGWDPREYEKGYKSYFVAARPVLPVVVKRRW